MRRPALGSGRFLAAVAAAALAAAGLLLAVAPVSAQLSNEALAKLLRQRN